MKKSELLHTAPLALSALLSLWLSLSAADAIAALGGEAVAALRSTQPGAQPLVARSYPTVAATTAADRIG